MAARTDQAPRPYRQLPPNASVSGTVAAAADEAPTFSAMEYRPVIAPTRLGKRSLTTPGSSTLAMAMPASDRAVSATNRAGSAASGRSARPAVSTVPATAMAPAAP